MVLFETIPVDVLFCMIIFLILPPSWLILELTLDEVSSNSKSFFSSNTYEEDIVESNCVVLLSDVTLFASKPPTTGVWMSRRVSALLEYAFAPIPTKKQTVCNCPTHSGETHENEWRSYVMP